MESLMGLRDILHKYARKTDKRLERKIKAQPRRYNLGISGRILSEIDYQAYKISSHERKVNLDLIEGRMTTGDERGRPRRKWI